MTFVAPTYGGGAGDSSLSFNAIDQLIFYQANGAAWSLSPTANTSTDWHLFVFTKATGTVTPRFHWYDYSTGTWTHENGNNTSPNSSATLITSIDIGQWTDGTSDRFYGTIAAVGMFRTVVPSDAELEASGLHYSLAAWRNYQRRSDLSAWWLLDQADSAMNLLDRSGGGANQTSATAPSVSTFSVPLLGYGAPVLPVSGETTPTQVLNPASDAATNSWVTDVLATTNLYQAIDEDAASDADYVQCVVGATSGSYYETALETGTDPASSADHVVKYRYQKGGGGGGATDVTVSLRQGAGTEIAAWTHTGIAAAWTQADQTLTGGQADAITNYADLRLRFAPTSVGASTPAAVASSTGTVSNLTGQSSTGLTVTSGMAGAIQVGHYVVAWVAVDNTGASGARPGLTVTDSRSNTWTVTTGALIDPGAASAGAACYLAYSKITTVYQTSDTITFTWTTGSPAAKSISVTAFSGIHPTSPVAVAEVAASGASTAFTISITPSAADQLVVAAGAIEGPSGDTWTNDADTTNGSWTAITEVSTGNTGATDMTLQGAYKVVTASGAQTWNSTITSRDWAANAIVFARDPGTNVQVSWAQVVLPEAAAGAVALDGSTSGVSSTSGAVNVAGAVAGTVTGVSSTALTTLAVARPVDGTAAAVSSTTGAVRLAWALTGTATAASSTTGAASLTQALAGAVTAASTTSGAATVSQALTGAVTAASSTAGAAVEALALTGAAAGVSTAAVTTIAVARPLTGTTAAVSSTAGDVSVAKPLTATVAAQSSTSATAGVAYAVTATATGASTTTGAAVVAQAVTGTVTGVSATTGQLVGQVPLGGAADALSSTSLNAVVAQALTGATAAASSTAADAVVALPLTGVTAAASAASANVDVARPLEGAAAGASSTAGAAIVALAVAGAVTAVSAASLSAILSNDELSAAADALSTTAADLSVARPVDGTSTAASTTSAVLSLAQRVDGTAAGVSATAAAPVVAQAITGAVTAVSSTSCDVETEAGISGTATAASTTAAALSVARPVTGTATAASSTSGALTASQALTGTTAAASAAALTALLTNDELAGTVTTVSSTTGALTVTVAAVAATAGQSSTAGTLELSVALTATATGASTVTATVTVTFTVAGTVAGQSSTTVSVNVAGAVVGLLLYSATVVTAWRAAAAATAWKAGPPLIAARTAEPIA